MQAHRELWDEGLVLTLQMVAGQMREKGQENGAEFLGNVAEQLAEALGMGGNVDRGQEVDTRSYLEFIQELFQAEMAGGGQAVFPVLKANRNLLDRNFSQVLENVVNNFIERQPEAKDDIVALVENITVRIQEFPLGNRADNLEIAIAGYEMVFSHRQPGSEKYAQTQNNLANAYNYRINGSRAENIERAIEYCQVALTVHTREDFPEHWATNQNNLANAYSNRINGSRAENLEQAIKYYQAALTVYKLEDFPEQWAGTLDNLSTAYQKRDTGDRVENLRQAINCLEKASQLVKKESFPQDWARLKNNLANAYLNINRIEESISAYEDALIFYTREQYPVKYASIQKNLGIAYLQY